MRLGRRHLGVVMMGWLLAGAGLLAAGRGPLARPPMSSWNRLESWYEGVGPGEAALAGLRLVALLGVGWIVISTGLQLLGGVSGCGIVQRIADGVSPRWLRRLAHSAAGLAVTVGLAGPPVPADPAGTAVMEVLEPPAPPATTTTTAPTPDPPAPPAIAPTLPADELVVVARGDSFWSLAVDAVAESGHAVAVDDYWRRFVELNRPRLVDSANPDLLYPGQVLVLPAIA